MTLNLSTENKILHAMKYYAGYSYNEAKGLLMFPFTRRPFRLQNGVYMFTDRHNQLNLLHSPIYDMEESPLVESLLKDGDVAVDVGANFGYYSLLFAKKCSKVYAFEPAKYNFAFLQRNIKLNEAGSIIIPENLAIGEKDDEMELHHNHFGGGGHSLAIDFDYPLKTSEMVRVTTLDNYFGKGTRIDFVKIDTEGFEEEAIKGMQGVLADNHEIILMFEHWKGVKDAEEYSILTRCGFALHLIRDGLHKLNNHAEFHEAHGNIIASRNGVCLNG